ncbi:MAG TPA: TetR/AcrR family transcriptional regulator [Acidimicrobiales bacterium]
MVGVKGQVQRRGVERRKAIVEAALELFAAKGARGTSIADVADKVGITPPAVLHHFGTKDDLLLAVIAERDRRAEGAFLDLLAEGGLAAIRNLAKVAEANQHERQLVACYVVLEAENLHDDDVAHCYFLTRSRNMRKAIGAALEAGQKRGEIRPDVDCAAKADEILAFMSGAAVQWSLDPSLSLTGLYGSYLDELVADLAADGRGASGSSGAADAAGAAGSPGAPHAAGTAGSPGAPHAAGAAGSPEASGGVGSAAPSPATSARR